jgi:L-lactate dehydrogenase (cytochrome)
VRAFNIANLRRAARARLPRMVFDYIDGGADDECTLRGNVERFSAYQLTWDALRDIAALSTATTVLGSPARLPFVICPTAASRLFDPRGGERAVARAAHAAGVIYCCSALATTSLEDIAAVNPGPKWFQLYAWKDRGILREMLARAKAAGFTAAILTVDVPVAGNRERDLRNGFTIPPRASARSALQALARPAYLYKLCTTGALRPEIVAGAMPAIDGSIVDFLNRQIDHSLSWRDIVWMIDAWAGQFAIKGIATAADARRCVDIGATGVWVSNHGGRQLDTAVATIDLLEPIVQAVGARAEVILDGGIRRGTDIVKALALGAQAAGIGRAYLYGLAAAGEAGVAHAIALLGEELRRDLALMGYSDIKSIRRDSVIAPYDARHNK